MERIAGYIRVSTGKQTLERQRKLIKDYCAKTSSRLVVLYEDKVSGTKSDRDGLNKILSLTKDDADIIVISELSRLSREDDAHNIINKVYDILNNGLDLVFLDQPEKRYKADSGISFTDYLILAIKAFGAADERKKITERLLSGKKSKFIDFPNMAVHGTAPTGYKVIKNPSYIPNVSPKSLIEIDEEQSKYIKIMFNLALDGYSSPEIMRKMNEMGAKSRNGTPLSLTAVKYILKNPIYKGTYEWFGVQHSIPAIIDEKTWELAQIRRKENVMFKTISPSHFNALKGIAKCICGHNLTLHTAVEGLRFSCADRMYFVGKNKGEIRCQNFGIAYEPLMRAVWFAVRTIVLDKEYKVKNDEEIRKIEDHNSSIMDTVDINRKEILRLNKQIEVIINNIANSTNVTVTKALNSKVEDLEIKIQDIEKANLVAEEEIRKNMARIEDIRDTETIKELNNFTDRQKADEFKRRLDSVIYRSENSKRGFIIINFKNGLQTVVAYFYSKGTHLVVLPDNLKYDDRKNKIIEWDIVKNKPIKEYTLEQFKLHFDYKQYEIKK